MTRLIIHLIISCNVNYGTVIFSFSLLGWFLFQGASSMLTASPLSQTHFPSVCLSSAPDHSE